jgi:hypothetical protein
MSRRRVPVFCAACRPTDPGIGQNVQRTAVAVLVTLDPRRPFSFLDDRLATGDSLLGITSADQLRDLHFDPKKGHALHENTLDLITADTDSLLKAASELRKEISEIDLRDARDAEHKQRLLNRSHELTGTLSLIADGMSGASLAGGADAHYLQLASFVGGSTSEDVAAEQKLRQQVQEWLTSSRTGERRLPAHYPLLFPEVFIDGRNGFDAVVGNPPYLGGQKLTGAFGVPYREHLVRELGHGARGSADLIAYMFLRACAVISSTRGQIGLIGTNTLAQGDTREVGLDQLAEQGLHLRAAIKSAPWPTDGANLEYCAVWAGWREPAGDVHRVLDGNPVQRITASLDAAGRVSGMPFRLAANGGIVFQGSNVLGLGFTMTVEEAQAMIAADPRNAEVLFPYVNGEDLNNRTDGSGSRWVINFFDWPLERAQRYELPMARVVALLKPERDLLIGRNSIGTKRGQNWWRYAADAKQMQEAIAHLKSVFALARVSKVVQPVSVPTGQVLSEACVVFASDDWALFAVLSSSLHYWWTVNYASTLETRIRYTPSDVFETFPLPGGVEALSGLGGRLSARRSDFMIERGIGLTKTYNMIHDPACSVTEIEDLRALHMEIDGAVLESHGWTDLIPQLEHGHYETRQGVRWTIAPAVQSEILDRLLELNHERYAAEVAAGLHDKGKKRPPRASRKKVGEDEATLFGERA